MTGVSSLTTQVKALVEVLRQIAAADARSAVWPTLKAFLAGYGYQRLTVFQNPDSPSLALAGAPGVVGADVLFSDVDAHTLEQFQRASGHHPAIMHALRVSEPFARSEVDAKSDDSGPVPLHQNLYPGEGLIVPLVENDISKGVAVLAGDEPDLSPVARSLVQVATENAFDRAQALLSSAKASAELAGLLSPRETAILSWAASGKTDAEIGELLKISARTVRFHTDNAKRKLRVTSRIQAVTESLRLGLIKL